MEQSPFTILFLLIKKVLMRLYAAGENYKESILVLLNDNDKTK